MTGTATLSPATIGLPGVPWRRFVRWGVATSLLAALTCMATGLWAAQPAHHDHDYERWYAVYFQGRQIGHMHASQTTIEDRVVSTARMEVRVARGEGSAEMSVEGQFVETVGGKPLAGRIVRRLGTTPQTTRYTFEESELVIEQGEGESRTTTRRPLPAGVWLPPAAAAQYVRQRLQAGADRFVVRTLDPLSGPEPAALSYTVVERTTMDVLGQRVPVVRCLVSSSSLPAVTLEEVLDARGIPVRSQVRVGPMVFSIETVAKAQAVAGEGTPLVDLMTPTFVRPDRAIARPRQARRGVYVLHAEGDPMPGLPAAGSQRVEPSPDGSVRVIVDLAGAVPADDQAVAAYLAPSPMIASDDALVRRLAERASRGVPVDPAEQARRLRAFVHRYMRQKDLDVVFADAREVARTRRGDCTEHAVLLAALLRARGIPARVVSGIVYAEQFAGQRDVFVYHMWTQALVDEGGQRRWLDLDPTLRDAEFDATHIALAVSALGAGEEMSSLASLLTTVGRLRIRVEAVE